jgi:hypothetical protein
MQLPILIEPTPDGRFRARLGDPFQLTAEADDAGRAVQDLVRLVEQRLQSGAKVAVLTLTNGAVQAAAPPFPADDAYKTDWVYRELEEAVAENRRLEESAGP